MRHAAAKSELTYRSETRTIGTPLSSGDIHALTSTAILRWKHQVHSHGGSRLGVSAAQCFTTRVEAATHTLPLHSCVVALKPSGEIRVTETVEEDLCSYCHETSGKSPAG